MRDGAGDSPGIAELRGGANQARVRAYNERLVLSLIRRHGSLSKAEIARRSGLSAQAVTIIMRALEQDALLVRGSPVRGKVGQPSIPMSLNPEGAFSLGLKIGRRSLDLILMDFTGAIHGRHRTTYDYPRTDAVTAFVRDRAGAIMRDLPQVRRNRIAGLGVAMPFELWNWADQLRVRREDMAPWRDFDVARALSAVTGLPVLVQNDGTAAAGAELLFGRGREASDYVYYFIGYFIGGGLVMDSRLVTGPQGNAGGIGTIRVGGPDGQRLPLLDCASLHILEDALTRTGHRAAQLWESPDDWSGVAPLIDDWIEGTARALAEAIISTCSVIDFPTIIIDGNLPANVRDALVAAVAAALDHEDMQGIRPFRLQAGMLGHNAQVLGGASLPIMARYLVDSAVLFKEPAPAQ